MALVLAGCGGDATIPEPQYACLKLGEATSNSRGGGFHYPCLERGIVCPKPTKLVTINGKLACRLEDQ